MLLAKTILERTQTRQDNLAQLRKQIEVHESALLKIGQKRFISEEIDAETYQRLKCHKQSAKEEILKKIHEIEAFSENVQQHCQFGMNFFTHMDFYFQEGSVEVKRKLLGSIFPGKLIFENGKYRTEGMNSALALILQKKSELEKRRQTHSHF